MATREAADFRWLKDRICHQFDRFERVENGIAPGMPDVNYCISDHEGWLELKHPKIPKRQHTPLFGSNHKIGIDQSNWFLRQLEAGGNAHLFIRTDKSCLLICGRLVSDFKFINNASFKLLENIATWSAFHPYNETDWSILRNKIINA